MEDSEVTYQRGRGLHQSAEEKLALTDEKISDLRQPQQNLSECLNFALIATADNQSQSIILLVIVDVTLQSVTLKEIFLFLSSRVSIPITILEQNSTNYLKLLLKKN